MDTPTTSLICPPLVDCGTVWNGCALIVAVRQGLVLACTHIVSEYESVLKSARKTQRGISPPSFNKRYLEGKGCNIQINHHLGCTLEHLSLFKVQYKQTGQQAETDKQDGLTGWQMND